jgi:hypothetical protein
MSQFRTYNQVGIKEDISDVITNISPTTTPFQSLLKGEKVSNTVYGWQEDSLADVADNAQLEGFTAADNTLAATAMRSNYTQIMAKTVNVTATADAVSTYGRAKETAYQLSKKSAELKREFEYHLVGKAQNAAAGDGTTARTFANAFGTYVGGAAVINSAVTVSIDGNGATAGTPAGALTEAAILEANQDLYEAGSDASYIMVKPADSLIIADFNKSAGRTRTFNDSNKTLVNAIDLYVSPFGEQKVIINRFLKASECLIFKPEMWRLVTLRPFTRELLAKTGDSDRHLIVGEFSLKHLNSKGSARITNLSGTNGNLPA